MRIFSLPLNPKLDQSQFNDYCNFLAQFKDYIYDIYFTSRIAPFNQDAMGDVFVMHDASEFCIESALYIQQTFGIPVSATFNNIHVTPDQKNLDLFIKNFKPLYDAGVRSATIPHTQWMMTGQIKKAFPDLFVKNTILRDVNRANQVYELAKAGFDYVNLDRDLMRDKDELEKIVKVKKLYPNLKISLLANEGCAGNCPIMDEHYQYNCQRTEKDPQYFTSSIARISCQHWDIIDPAIQLKTANLPPWKEDWQELLDLGIDTFKMHGRESINRIAESMRIIHRWANNETILVDGFEDYLADNNLQERPIDAWRKIIKNCKFDCWDCGYCDKIYNKKSTNQQHPLVEQVANIVATHPNNNLATTDIVGLTSHRVRQLLFDLGKNSTSYLEVGCYQGATATAVLDSNISKAYFVDHWQENIQPANGTAIPTNSKDTFIANIKKHKQSTDIKLFDCEFQNVDKQAVNNVDLFFYDGPHDAQTTAQAVEYFASCLTDTSVLVFDDANWDGVVSGARHGIQTANLKVLYDKILLNEQEDPSQWWNGFYIVVVQK